LRRRQLPVESDLVPYVAGFPPGGRWLVLVPHPDDEVFGLGATLAQGVRRGVQVTLVIVTNGGAQGRAIDREREVRASAAALGLGEPELWNLADRSLEPRNPGLRRALRDALERHAPDAVFVTSPVEFHPDHRALALALQSALRASTFAGLRRRGPAWVVAYEVGTPLLPNLLVAADEAWEVKQRAAACYASQLAFRPYDRVMEALGTLRRLTLTDVEHAEAMHVLPAHRVVRLSARAWASLMGAPTGVVVKRAR
jgi:LmbE family N-acetylglucosaminyl deacetylase